ncbi:hypothetical protein E4U30_005348 [Claviceps sp. LM220 group G6]|nr:hypothetical protein E4U30_005348 [Claviceps sp. LM220 group G6]
MSGERRFNLLIDQLPASSVFLDCSILIQRFGDVTELEFENWAQMEHDQRTQKHYESFVGKLAQDRDDGTFCDLEIDCGERRFRAHRNVVCLHSPVIRAAFFGKWKKEPTCGVFEIKEHSHMLVRRMLDYIYIGDYDDFDSSILVQNDHLSPEDVAKLEIAGQVPLHVKMMELGNTYLVEGLSQLTSYKFTKHLVSLLTMSVIVDIIPKVYALDSGPSDAIRKSVIGDMREKLLRRPLTADIEELLDDVMKNVPQFTCHLLKSYLDTPHGSVPRAGAQFPFIRSGFYIRNSTYASSAQKHYYHEFEAARGVFEIKETSHMLVRRMLDYIYTGDYDNFDSSILLRKDHLSPQEVAEFTMMELGDMYMVEGLSQLTSEKFAKHLASQTARYILVTIVPKVYALKNDSSDTIRKVVIDCMRQKMSRIPLADDVEEVLEDVAKNVPKFTCELLKSYMKVYDDSRMDYGLLSGAGGFRMPAIPMDSDIRL